MQATVRTTKQQILQAAEATFTKFGPRKTSMADIALQAGLARATVYLHFANKKSLYRELLTTLRDDLMAKMKEVVDSEQKSTWKLRRFVELTITTYTGSTLLYAALRNDPDMAIGKIAKEVMEIQNQGMIDIIKSILLQGIQTGELRKLDPDRTAYLMHQLGKHLVLDELGGSSKYKLEDILLAMDELIAFGLIQRNQEVSN